MKVLYEAMLASLAAEKDSDREKLRSQMQSVIEDLKRQLEEEKQNMGAAGKRREDELLKEIANLKKELQSTVQIVEDLKQKNSQLD